MRLASRTRQRGLAGPRTSSCRTEGPSVSQDGWEHPWTTAASHHRYLSTNICSLPLHGHEFVHVSHVSFPVASMLPSSVNNKDLLLYFLKMSLFKNFGLNSLNLSARLFIAHIQLCLSASCWNWEEPHNKLNGKMRRIIPWRCWNNADYNRKTHQKNTFKQMFSH